jgi:hypothetical protein
MNLSTNNIRFEYPCDLFAPPVGQCIGYNEEEDTFHHGSFDSMWNFYVNTRLVTIHQYMEYSDLKQLVNPIKND